MAPYEISSLATPKGEASPKPAAHPTANLRLYEIEVEAEIEGIRGFAAVGVPMTLHPKRANDTAVGPFLGKGLPPGWG